MRKTVLLANTPSNTRAIAAALTKAPRTESEKPSDSFFFWFVQFESYNLDVFTRKGSHRLSNFVHII